MFQTTYEFTLPKGYVDEAGNIHKNGIMRLATAMDEISAMGDPRVRQDSDYEKIIALSKVIMRLGDLGVVTADVIEGLFTVDLNFLKNMYDAINKVDGLVVHVTCPCCGKEFTDTISFDDK